MTFQHEVFRNDEPVTVLVRARVYRDGVEGSLGCERAFYADILSVRTLTGEPVDLTRDEAGVVESVAVSLRD